jgi:hypothetical protein
MKKRRLNVRTFLVEIPDGWLSKEKSFGTAKFVNAITFGEATNPEKVKITELPGQERQGRDQLK